MALRLHDVSNAEGFVASIVQRSKLELGPEDRQDLAQFLLIELWRLSQRYEYEGRPRFSSYAYRVLPKRIIDWQRKRFGRRTWKSRGRVIHARPRPHVVSLDGPERLERDLAPGTSGPEAD